MMGICVYAWGEGLAISKEKWTARQGHVGW
jgi:hypothetical protein